VLEGGSLLEKAAVNTTVVRGTLSAQRAQAMCSRQVIGSATRPVHTRHTVYATVAFTFSDSLKNNI
jgi:hypothetical protein